MTEASAAATGTTRSDVAGALCEISGLEKRYGELRALRDVSLVLAPGRIGLLGPNGAGKSTMLRVLLGLIAPDRGSVRVLGFDVAREPFAVRARLGYMPEGDAVLPDLTALEYVTLAAELCGLPRAQAIGRAHRVLHDCGLGEARYRKLGSFSTGMKQRARLAQALVADPALLLLDEPTSGLDPRGREEMLDLVVEIPRRTGASVILSTHILPDVERTCDQVVLLSSGEVLYAGPLARLLQTDRETFEVRTRGEPAALRRGLEAAGCLVEERPGGLEVRLPAAATARLVLEVALSVGVTVRHLAPMRQTLERAFLRAVGEGANRSEGRADLG
ncbi:MAG: ABC transporter ATP-binding protein [Myxococcota bacterium]|nr:ABC transporter ATP-binding protein [Myxococcota bacterium]